MDRTVLAIKVDSELLVSLHKQTTPSHIENQYHEPHLKPRFVHLLGRFPIHHDSIAVDEEHNAERGAKGEHDHMVPRLLVEHLKVDVYNNHHDKQTQRVGNGKQRTTGLSDNTERYLLSDGQAYLQAAFVKTKTATGRRTFTA